MKNVYKDLSLNFQTSKSFRSMAPLKLGLQCQKKNFSGQKKFLGAPKMKKVDFLKKLSVNILETIDFQNNLSREPKIHWQILVNIFHNPNGLQERCDNTMYKVYINNRF